MTPFSDHPEIPSNEPDKISPKLKELKLEVGEALDEREVEKALQDMHDMTWEDLKEQSKDRENPNRKHAKIVLAIWGDVEEFQEKISKSISFKDTESVESLCEDFKHDLDKSVEDTDLSKEAKQEALAEMHTYIDQFMLIVDQAQEEPSAVRQLAAMGIELIPYVGTSAQMIGALRGTNLAGERMTGRQRLAEFAWGAGGLTLEVGGALTAGAGLVAVEGGRVAAFMARHGDKLPKLLRFGDDVVKHADNLWDLKGIIGKANKVRQAARISGEGALRALQTDDIISLEDLNILHQQKQKAIQALMAV